MKKVCTALLFFFLSLNASQGNELRAGEITVEQISSTSIEATIRLMIDIHSDLEDLTISWGDGFATTFQSVTPEILADYGLKGYTVTALHTYPQSGTFTVSIVKCCFDDDIINISEPSTQNFEISTTFNLGSQFNTTPRYSDWGFGISSAGQVAGITGFDDDPEGDAITSLICDISATGYVQPDEVFPAPDVIFSNSETSGAFSWISPFWDGIYLAQACVSEVRGGTEISFSKRIVCFLIGDFSPSAVQPLEAAGLQIYPNPVVNKTLRLQPSNHAAAKQMEFQLFNAQQQLVLQTQLEAGAGDWSIDLTGVAAGIYFVFVQTENQNYYHRLVVTD